MPVRTARSIAIAARPPQAPPPLAGLVALALGSLGLIGCARASLGDASFEREMYLHACGRGEAQACGDLGDRLLALDVATDDSERAIAVVMRACANGSGRACATIGRAYMRGKVVPRSPSTAASFLEQACVHGDVQGCLELADVLDRHDVAASPEKMFTVGVFACTHGDAGACHRLAYGALPRRLSTQSTAAKAP